MRKKKKKKSSKRGLPISIAVWRKDLNLPNTFTNIWYVPFSHPLDMWARHWLLAPCINLSRMSIAVKINQAVSYSSTKMFITISLHVMGSNVRSSIGFINCWRKTKTKTKTNKQTNKQTKNNSNNNKRNSNSNLKQSGFPVLLS